MIPPTQLTPPNQKNSFKKENHFLYKIKVNYANIHLSRAYLRGKKRIYSNFTGAHPVRTPPPRGALLIQNKNKNILMRLNSEFLPAKIPSSTCSLGIGLVLSFLHLLLQFLFFVVISIIIKKKPYFFK